MTPDVVHLIPRIRVGGIETAAFANAARGEPQPLVVTAEAPDRACLESLPESVKARLRWPTGGSRITGTLWALRQCLQLRPRVLVCSVYTVAVGLVVRVLRPQTQVVAFFHNPRFIYPRDRVLATLAQAAGLHLWADAEATAAWVRGWAPGRHVAVVPHFLPGPGEPIHQRPAASFVFAGRLDPQKDIGRAIRLIAALRGAGIPATLDVFGPDWGDLAVLRRVVADERLHGVVRYRGVLTPDQVRRTLRNYRYYLQTSVYEGTAMAVYEAMQLGLVPVVCPVGAISEYATDGVSAVFVGSAHGPAIAALRGLEADGARYGRMSEAARGVAMGRPDYVEVFGATVRGLIGG